MLARIERVFLVLLASTVRICAIAIRGPARSRRPEAVACLAAVLGFIYGSLTSSVEEFIGDNEAMADLLASLEGVSLVDSYLSTSLLITVQTTCTSLR